jgi:hypothetical protein
VTSTMLLVISRYLRHTVKSQQRLRINPLTLNLLTTTIVAPPSNASKWQMGFNSAFKGLNAELNPICHLLALLGGATIVVVSRLRVKLALFFSAERYFDN